MLLVFDLDFTLWDAGGTWCDHTSPPYHKKSDHIIDGDGRNIHLYPDVREILNALNNQGICMALASRTHSPYIAIQLLELFGIRSFFKYEEIYPGSKIQHFESLQKQSRVPYRDTYFFDDEYRNVAEVGALGVDARLVDSGLDRTAILQIPGLENLL